jgi:hypothetical protein
MAGGIIGGRDHGFFRQNDTFVRIDEVHDRPASVNYHGDVRVLLGFGFRVPFGERFTLGFDPYTSTSITSMGRDLTTIVARDHGLRLTLAAVRPGRGITEGRFRRKAPVMEADPG